MKWWACPIDEQDIFVNKTKAFCIERQTKSLRFSFTQSIKRQILGTQEAPITVMKKLTLFRLSFLLLALLLPNITHAGGVNYFEVDGIYYFTTGNDATVKTPYSNYYSGDLTIPSTVGWDSGLLDVVEIDISGCPNLTSITIPNSVRSLYLSGCTGLTSLTIPNSVISLNLPGCTGLTSITIPNSVTSLYLPGCTGLTSVSIPNSVRSIGDNAFNSCTGLTSVSIPNSVTSIGDVAFEGCTGLTSIEIPNSVTSIGGYAFYGCTGLTSVTIPNSVTTIEGGAFSDCTGLTSVIIGSGVTYIRYKTFYGCDALDTVKCLGTVPPRMESIDCFSTAAYNNATLYVPSGCKDIYEATNYWYKFIHPIVVIVIYDVTGDVNGDGSVTIADVTALIDILLGNGTAPAAADVNGDGSVTIADVTALIDMLLGN